MSREEMINKIDVSLRSLSDIALDEVLKFLKKIESIEDENLEDEISLIFTQDNGLLKRLAQ